MTDFFPDTVYQSITNKNTSERFQWINTNLAEILDGNYNLSRRKSYCVPSHYEPFDRAEFMKIKQQKPFRREEWMCKLSMGRTFPLIGTIVDYQVPLKHNMSCEGMGKVDLLARNGDTAWLLELKVPYSTESPLRAIMEIFTYWKQLGGNDSAYFLERSAASGAVTLKKAIVLFQEGANRQSTIVSKLKKDVESYRTLMEKLDVVCFIASLMADDPDHIQIEGIKPWR